VREGRERMVLKGPCGDRAEKILRKKIDENFGLFTLLDRGRAQKARNSNWCVLELLCWKGTRRATLSACLQYDPPVAQKGQVECGKDPCVGKGRSKKGHFESSVWESACVGKGRKRSIKRLCGKRTAHGNCALLW
jgi:hypothetical protein